MTVNEFLPYLVMIVPVVFLVLALIIGIRLVWAPFQVIGWAARSASTKLGPAAFLLVCLWTVALVPEPFLQFGHWLIRFGQTLLVDAPSRAFAFAAKGGQSCRDNPDGCFQQIVMGTDMIWRTALSEPLGSLELPSLGARAVLFFAIGVTAIVVYRRKFDDLRFQAINKSFITTIGLVISFLAALYLAIVSIIAIPVVGQAIPDLSTYNETLSRKIADALPVVDKKYIDLGSLVEERKNLPGVGSFAKSLQSTASSMSQQVASLSTVMDSRWDEHLGAWDKAKTNLSAAAQDLPNKAQKFSQRVKDHFISSNNGRVGVRATENHSILLSSGFQSWVYDYQSQLDKCFNGLRDQITAFRLFHANVSTALRLISNSENPQDVSPYIPAFTGRNFELSCQDMEPNTQSSDYLIARSGTDENLGIFGAAAGWLLKTESSELTLIIGLLGFGFFGALAASFIREFRETEGDQLPPVGFIVPALIRGVGAAIVVFLLAKGGAAILTKNDAAINPWAIFAACLIAAVFSEDVWSWAQKRQAQQLGSGDKQSGADPASQQGVGQQPNKPAVPAQPANPAPSIAGGASSPTS